MIILSTLHRAIVSLPAPLLARRDCFDERIVFFTAADRPAERLEQLLALNWHISTAGWVDQGVIYNVHSLRELRANGLSDDLDARLFEIGCGPAQIHYAAPAEVDLFVAPNLRTHLHTILLALPQHCRGAA